MPDSLLESYLKTQENPAAVPPKATARLTNVYDQTGNPLPIEDVSGALAEGRAYFDADQTYSVLSPQQQPHSVKGDQVYNVLRKGWALESDEAKELRHRQAKAGLAEHAAATGLGVAESLTFGIAPAVADLVGGDEVARGWKRATETSPTGHTIGEVLGLATPLGVEGLAARGLTKGAVGTAASVATAAPRGVSKLAARAGEKIASVLPTTTPGFVRKGAELGVAGALEGSVYGAGFAVGEASLGDKELTAERLLAGAGSGALLGAGIGGGLGVASVGASRAANRIGAELPGFAEKMAFRTTGARGSEMRRVGLDQARASGRRMLDEGLVSFSSLEERAAALRKATESAGKEIDRLVRGIDELGHRPDLVPIVKKLDEQVGALRAGLRPGADTKLARKLEREYIDQLRESMISGKSTFKELHSFRARVDDYKDQASRKGDKTEFNELVKLRKTIEDELQIQADSAANRIGGDFTSGYTAAKARYKDLVAARDVAEKMAPMEGAKSFGFYDKAAAVAGLMTMGPKGLLVAGASKLAREHGDAAVALIADKLSKKAAPKPSLAEVLGGAKPVANDTFPTGLPAINDLRGEVPEGLPSVLDDAPGLTSPVTGQRAANNQWAAAGVNDNARANVPGASNDNLGTSIPSTSEQIAANNNALKEAKKEAKSKLEALGYVKEKADKVALQISKGAKDAVSAGSHKVMPKVPAGAVAYEALAADAREHRIAPDRSAIKIAARVEPLVHSAPQLASAVNAKLTGDLGYLASKLPSAGLAGLSPEQAKNVVPSGSERASFVRQARAIADPKTLIFDMKKGRLSDDALEAIRERRPLLLAKIQEEAEAAYAQLVKEGRAPSRQARLQFEKLTGKTVDPASNPMVVKIVQQVYQEQAKAMAAPTQPTPMTSIKRADRIMSQSESIAYGEQ